MENNEELFTSQAFRQVMALINKFEQDFLYSNDLRSLTADDVRNAFNGMETRKLKNYLDMALNDVYPVSFKESGITFLDIFNEDSYETDKGLFTYIEMNYSKETINRIHMNATLANEYINGMKLKTNLIEIKGNINGFVGMGYWRKDSSAFQFLKNPVEKVIHDIFENIMSEFYTRDLKDLILVDPTDHQKIANIFSTFY